MQTLKDVLEILYYLSGPALAIAAFWGLKQLKIAKENSKTNAKRESLKLSANQCKFYLEHIIPSLNKLNEKLDENDIDFTDRVKIEITNDRISIQPKKDKPDVFEGVDLIIMELTTALNLLESFALFFISGVADEEAAYSSVGSTFCNSVKKLLPIIVPLNKGDNYKNILKLFIIWDRRLKTKELIKNKNELERKLSETESFSINPVGT